MSGPGPREVAGVTGLWTWDSSVPGAEGAGVCDDEDRAKRAAAAWMTAHGADSGVVELVRLAAGGRTMVPHHEPTGVTLRARRGRDGRVRWAPARAAA